MGVGLVTSVGNQMAAAAARAERAASAGDGSGGDPDPGSYPTPHALDLDTLGLLTGLAAAAPLLLRRNSGTPGP
ncbi:hypothetical protein OV450_0733 [Actinobacteria bacterium OV450]|nr:hypothetical protein OV450_0733 [Actinobacteria bacterium OV450]